MFEQLRKALDSKELSATELTCHCLTNISKHNKSINAFLAMNQDGAMQAAKAADLRIARGETGPLLGIPVGIKDLIATRDLTTTAASRILEDFVPPYDATVTQRLHAASAPILGKLNLDEFGMGSSNEHSAFGPVKNPWNLDCVPGGSSGGSAASVAAAMCPVSLGTDTGGSIRQPASFCGLTGLKPTYGRVSRFGLLAYASSMDQIGPLGVDALSCAATLNVIAGVDPRDATSNSKPVEDYFLKTLEATQKHPSSGLRIGIVPELQQLIENDDTLHAFHETQERLKSLGATFTEIQFKSFPYALSTYYLLSTSEASSNLSRYDGVHVGSKKLHDEKIQNLEELMTLTRTQGFGDEVKLRIYMGAFALSSGYYDAYYKKAAQVRRWIQNEFIENFHHCDLILTPCTPTPAFRFGEKTQDPLDMYRSDIFTIPVNLAGLPALSLPVKLSKSGLPIGLQLIAPWWNEASLLAQTAALQRAYPETLLATNAWKTLLGF